MCDGKTNLIWLNPYFKLVFNCPVILIVLLIQSNCHVCFQLNLNSFIHWYAKWQIRPRKFIKNASTLLIIKLSFKSQLHHISRLIKYSWMGCACAYAIVCKSNAKLTFYGRKLHVARGTKLWIKIHFFSRLSSSSFFLPILWMSFQRVCCFYTASVLREEFMLFYLSLLTSTLILWKKNQ